MIFNKFQKQQALTFINTIFDKDKKVKIEQVADKRTIDQNSLYWLWLTCISKETGVDVDTIHYEIKKTFLTKRKNVLFGKEVDEVGSTKTLNTKEFKELLDNVQLLANEYNIKLLNPEDKYFTEFYETYKDYI